MSTRTEVTIRAGVGERRKAGAQAAAREAIFEVAEQMFFERGFDEVTLDQIAEACGVSVRTVLRYFPGKEMLALARPKARLEAFREGLADHRGDVLGYWREHVLSEVVMHAAQQGEWLRKQLLMITSSPTLLAHSAWISHQYEECLAAAFAEETDDAGFGPRMLASVLVAGNLSATQHWFRSGGTVDASLHLAVIDFAEKSVLPHFRHVKPSARRGAR